MKKSGDIINEYGLTEYLPTGVLFKWSALASFVTLIPLTLASVIHKRNTVK